MPAVGNVYQQLLETKHKHMSRVEREAPFLHVPFLVYERCDTSGSKLQHDGIELKVPKVYLDRADVRDPKRQSVHVTSIAPPVSSSRGR